MLLNHVEKKQGILHIVRQTSGTFLKGVHIAMDQWLEISMQTERSWCCSTRTQSHEYKPPLFLFKWCSTSLLRLPDTCKGLGRFYYIVFTVELPFPLCCRFSNCLNNVAVDFVTIPQSAVWCPHTHTKSWFDLFITSARQVWFLRGITCQRFQGKKCALIWTNFWAQVCLLLRSRLSNFGIS